MKSRAGDFVVGRIRAGRVAPGANFSGR